MSLQAAMTEWHRIVKLGLNLKEDLPSCIVQSYPEISFFFILLYEPKRNVVIRG